MANDHHSPYSGRSADTADQSKSTKPGVDIRAELYSAYKGFVTHVSGSYHSNLGDSVTRAMSHDIALFCAIRGKDNLVSEDSSELQFHEKYEKYIPPTLEILFQAAVSIERIRRALYELRQQELGGSEQNHIALDHLVGHLSKSDSEQAIEAMWELDSDELGQTSESLHEIDGHIVDSLIDRSESNDAAVSCRVDEEAYIDFKEIVSYRNNGSFYGQLGPAFEQSLALDMALYFWSNIEEYFSLYQGTGHELSEEACKWLPTLLKRSAPIIRASAYNISPDFIDQADPSIQVPRGASDRDFKQGQRDLLSKVDAEEAVTGDRPPKQQLSSEEKRRLVVENQELPDPVPPSVENPEEFRDEIEEKLGWETGPDTNDGNKGESWPTSRDSIQQLSGEEEGSRTRTEESGKSQINATELNSEELDEVADLVAERVEARLDAKIDRMIDRKFKQILENVSGTSDKNSGA